MRLLPRQLPPTIGGFVNRLREIEQLRQFQGSPDGDTPLPAVAIVGSAGVGKTTLALHWLHSIRGDFTDGDLFLNLRGYDVDRPVSATVSLGCVIRDLGIPPSQIPADLDDRARMFRSLIAGRRLLIFLDNVSSASQVRPLIPGAAGPLLVITSRTRLPGISVRTDLSYVQVDVLHEADAADLVRTVTRANRPADADVEITELVRLCARLPLALRIAAERAASRPAMLLTELIEDLRDKSGLWEALSIADGTEIDSVRAVFAWSYRSLPEQMSWMFRVIGLHPGADISLAAAAAAAGMSLREARRSIDVLVGAFLLDRHAGNRFQMHDLLRAYAEAESTTQDSPQTRRDVLLRLLCWYVRSADEASTWLAPQDRLVPGNPLSADIPTTTFTSAGEALAWFEAERHNLTALVRLAESADMPECVLSLAVAPSPIYMNYFFFDDWAEMSRSAIAVAAALEDDRDRALAHENRGKYLLRCERYQEAREEFETALRLFDHASDARGAAETTNSLGLVCLRLRDLDSAVNLFASADDRFAGLNDTRWQGVCRSNLAEARIERGDFASALSDLVDLLDIFDRLNDVAMRGNTLWLIAWARRAGGDLPGAKTAIDKALAIAEAAQNKMWEGFWLLELARIQLALGDAQAASLSCQLAAALQRQIGDRSREAMAIQCMGDILLRLENWSGAAAFYRNAALQFHALGETWNEAVARIGLANATATSDSGDEREQLAQAYWLLEGYTDERALELKRVVRNRLASAGSGST